MLILLFVSAGGAAVPARQPSATTPEQNKEIAQAETVDDLVALAKKYLLRSETAPAAACVEKICRIEPGRLTDSEKQIPSSWNDFWFTQRALIREDALAADDADGRVELAQWLHAAGLAIPAGDMLERALAIDGKHARARELAAAWHLYGGGPIDFDLTPALSGPLQLESVRDDGEELKPRRGDTFILLPFRYRPAESQQRIRYNDLKVATAEGDTGKVIGIMLLEANISTGRRGGYGSGASSFATRGDTLYEQLQVPAAGDADVEMITCLNLRSPGRRIERDNRRQQTKASGLAAFIVEIPIETKILQCALLNALQLELDMDYLQALSQPVADLDPAGRQQLIQAMSTRAVARTAAIAEPAVRKLLEIRNHSAGQGNELSPAPRAALEAVILLAVGHPATSVSAAAYAGLLSDARELPDATAQAIKTCNRPQALDVLLDRIDETLSTKQPDVPAPAAVIDMLKACMAANDANIRSRAASLLMRDGSEQALAALKGAGGAADKAMVEAFKEIEGLKTGVETLRALLAQASPEVLPELLAKLPNARPVINGENDPLLLLLSRPTNTEQAVAVLDFLSRADFTAVADSKVLADLLEKLRYRFAKDEKVMAAMCDTGRAQLEATPFTSPLRLNWPTAANAMRSRTGMQWPAFARLMSALALNATSKTADAALTALIESGCIGPLFEGLETAESARRDQLIQKLVNTESLWNYDATPMIIADCARYEGQTAKLALAGLAFLYQKVPNQQHWRLDLAIRQAVDWKVFVEATAGSEPNTIQHAEQVLVRICRLAPPGLNVYRNEFGADARSRLLAERYEDVTPRVGTSMHSLLIIELGPPGAAAPRYADVDTRDLVLPSETLTVEAGDGQVLRLTSPRGEIGRTPGNPSRATADRFEIDTTPLIRAALASPEAMQAGWPAKIDTGILNEQIPGTIQTAGFESYRGQAEIRQRHAGSPGPDETTPRLTIRRVWLLVEPAGQRNGA